MNVSILLVEDDVAVREPLGEALESAGYTVAACGNGSEALAMLKVVTPAVIILDIAMPVMDGAEFRQVQSRDEQLNGIPTIVMTGTKRDPQLDEDVAEVLIKPIHPGDLVAVVNRFCGPT